MTDVEISGGRLDVAATFSGRTPRDGPVSPTSGLTAGCGCGGTNVVGDGAVLAAMGAFGWVTTG